MSIPYDVNGTQQYDRVVSPKAIPSVKSANVIFTQTEITYNGKEQEPEISVKIGKTILVKGTDYTVTYANNKEVGTATVTITGKGNYTGRKGLLYISDLYAVRNQQSSFVGAWESGFGINGYSAVSENGQGFDMVFVGKPYREEEDGSVRN